jgi:hypothetical protein
MTNYDTELGLKPVENNRPCDMDECTACGRILDTIDLMQTPLGYYICKDSDECIAHFSEWDK